MSSLGQKRTSRLVEGISAEHHWKLLRFLIIWPEIPGVTPQGPAGALFAARPFPRRARRRGISGHSCKPRGTWPGTSPKILRVKEDRYAVEEKHQRSGVKQCSARCGHERRQHRAG